MIVDRRVARAAALARGTFSFPLVGAGTAAAGASAPSSPGRGGGSGGRREPVVEPMERRLLFAAGSLDATFNGTGRVSTDVTGTGASFASTANAVAVQSDGKVVVAGAIYDTSKSNADFGLVRYNANGSLDGSFGSGGHVLLSFDTGGDFATAVAIQSDGKIVVAGTTSTAPTAVARYTAAGVLDTTFGSGGKYVSPTGDGSTDCVAIQPDGKILLGGGQLLGEFAVVGRITRLTTAGALDCSFGTGGLADSATSAGAYYDKAIALQSDGRIVAAGQKNTGSQDSVVDRFNANGTTDASFGGVAASGIGSTYHAWNAVAVQPDGKILVAGSRDDSGSSKGLDFDVARFTSTGALDGGFGSGGVVATDFAAGDDVAQALRLLPNGQVAVAGYVTNSGSTTGEDFGVARYSAGGALDGGFGSGGIVGTDFFSTGDIARPATRRTRWPCSRTGDCWSWVRPRRRPRGPSSASRGTSTGT